MSEELLKPITEKLNAISEEIEKLKNAKPPEVDFSPLDAKITALEEKFANAAKVESEAKTVALKTEFRKSLNAAAATEIDTLWDEVKSLNPVEYESWKQANAGKLLTEVEQKETKGKKQTNAAGGFDLASEQARVFGY